MPEALLSRSRLRALLAGISSEVLAFVAEERASDLLLRSPSDGSEHFLPADLGRELHAALDQALQQRLVSLLDGEEPAEARLAEARRFRAETQRLIDGLARVAEEHRRRILQPRRVRSSRWLVALPDGTHVDTEGMPPREAYALLARHSEDIDRDLAGWLLHGDNRDALALMAERVRGRVSAVYLDPPYNTGEEGFVYRDGFRPEVWRAMMRQALAGLPALATDTAFLAVSINENELVSLLGLGREVLGKEAYAGLYSVRVRHEDRILTGDKEIQEVLEYLVLLRLGPRAFAEGRQVQADDLSGYTWAVHTTAPPQGEEILGGRRAEVFAPSTFTLEEVPASRAGLKRINIRGTLRRANSSGRLYVQHVEPHLERLQGCLLKVYGMGADGLGYRWFWLPPAEHRRRNPDYFQGVPLDQQATRRVPYPNLLDFEPHFNRVAAEGGVDFRGGKKPLAFLEHVLTIAGVAARPEGVVVDLFAGSGSTAHCVLQMNRRDGGRRKYLLAESGDHIHRVTIPRLHHAACEALPSRPLLQQILTLESWEDALHHTLLDVPPVLTDPWGLGWDVVETFHLLIGLRVHSYDAEQPGLLRVEGLLPGGEAAVVLWRDCATWSDEATLALLDAVAGSGVVYANGWPAEEPGVQRIEAVLRARMAGETGR